jgi:hypothetical protein
MDFQSIGLQSWARAANVVLGSQNGLCSKILPLTYFLLASKFTVCYISAQPNASMRTLSLVNRLRWSFGGNMNPHALVVGDVDNDGVCTLFFD